MVRRFPSRLAGVLVTIGILLSLGTFATTMQANAVDFNCGSGTVCVFPNRDLTGNYPLWDGPAQLLTDAFNGSWMSFSSVDVTPNPGSARNGSTGSCFWVFDKQDSRTLPVPPGAAIDLAHSFGYFFIQFGVNPCPASPPPGRP